MKEFKINEQQIKELQSLIANGTYPFKLGEVNGVASILTKLPEIKEEKAKK